MAHCYYCDAKTDNDNLEEINGAIVRVCDSCRDNPEMGGSLYADKIESERSHKIEHKSFDPDANWLAELDQIKKEQEAMALIDDETLLKITKELERLKNAEAEFKAKLQEIMERKGSKLLKTKYFTISYIEEHSQTKLDQAALKTKYPEIYDEFLKKSPVKASVKITLKKEKK